MSRTTALAVALLVGGGWSCVFPFNNPCDIAPVALEIGTTDSVHVGQTIGLVAHYEEGLLPACAGTWSSENPNVLLVKASATTTTSAFGVAPGTANIRFLIGTDSAVAAVTVTP